MTAGRPRRLELRVGGHVEVARHERVDDGGVEPRLVGLHQSQRGGPGEPPRPKVPQHHVARPGLGGERVEIDQHLCRGGEPP